MMVASTFRFFILQEDYSYYEANDPFVQNFIAKLDQILTSLKVGWKYFMLLIL